MNLLSDEERIKQKEKRKKILVIAACGVLGAFVILGALALALPAIDGFLKDKRRSELEQMTRRTYIYPEPDYTLDIFEEPAYLSLDRNVWVSDTMVKTVITYDNYDEYPEEMQFMYDVVNMIIRGDFIEYNKIFTADYVKKAGSALKERFTMQQLFEIEIEYADFGELDNDIIYYDIMLTYRIRNNNGTFRNDLDVNDDGSLPVVYKVITDGRSMKVADVLTHVQYSSGLY